ncbi:MAG TPA: hypothetical protein VMZ92_06620 [Planctomycetota bacterium]|nr:hypothetical protein [Planctomycetota bacterium]
MKNWARFLFSSLTVGLLLLAFSGEACAYIDWGTGSFLIQMAIAGLVGASYAVKVFWKQIKTFFAGLFGKKRKTEGEDEPH